jgi:hypothetical protein
MRRQFHFDSGRSHLSEVFAACERHYAADLSIESTLQSVLTIHLTLSKDADAQDLVPDDVRGAWSFQELPLLDFVAVVGLV